MTRAAAEDASGALGRALRLREKAAAEDPSDDLQHELAVTCFQAGEFRRDAELVRKALAVWQELASRRPEYRKYADTALRLLQNLS